MTFSRSHAGMMGIISLFTGMIAPIGKVDGRGYPFPLTDIQGVAYIFMLLLALGFYLVSVRKWSMFRLLGILIIILLIYMMAVLITGNLSILDSSKNLENLSWGWIFLIIGSLGILYSIWHKEYELESEFGLFSDMIIGAVGAFTLIGLTGLIISVSIEKVDPKSTSTILSSIFGTGGVTSSSGVTLSRTFQSIENFSFERKNDSISFTEKTQSGFYVFPEDRLYDEDIYPINLSEERYILSKDSYIQDTTEYAHSGYILLEKGFAIAQNGGVRIITEKTDTIHTGTINIKTIISSENKQNFAWIESSGSTERVIKDGNIASEWYSDIISISLSKSGYDTMALVRDKNGDMLIIKNGTPIDTLRSGYVSDSWKSNGSHFLYQTVENGAYRVIYDGVSTGKEFSEIRETFLEKSGNAYAFFGRILGENSYCLITRYRGSLCGLTGYMNPRLGADESSIIFAGYKDSTWSIYRNTATIIEDTGYTSNDVSSDYVFYDITNPKQYIFLQKIGEQGYQIRKNGKPLPTIYEDVGLDVSFGYDNNVLLPVRDASGWRIAEI